MVRLPYEPVLGEWSRWRVGELVRGLDLSQVGARKQAYDIMH